MIFTLCIEDKEWKRDIKVNAEQKIGETILILIDGGVLPYLQGIDNLKIFSERVGKYVDLEKNYQQEQIYQGDILHITQGNKR